MITRLKCVSPNVTAFSNLSSVYSGPDQVKYHGTFTQILDCTAECKFSSVPHFISGAAQQRPFPSKMLNDRHALGISQGNASLLLKSSFGSYVLILLETPSLVAFPIKSQSIF